MFKKIALLGLVALAFSCAKEKDGFTINTSFNDAVNGKKIKLFRTEGQTQIVIDSTIITDGNAVLEGTVTSPDIYFMEIEEVRGNIPVMLENEELTATINTDSIYSTRFTGGQESEIFNAYQDYMLGLQKMNQELSAEFQVAQQTQDSVLAIDIQSRYKAMVEENLAHDIEFMKTNNDAVISALILERHLMNPTLTAEQKKEIYDNFTPKLKETNAGKC